MATTLSTLQDISPDRIRKNPDNPRLVFREEEMNELLDSIKEVGIKVPVSLYADGQHFVLLDGERRWRCAKKLNLKSMPAIVQPKPTRLENLLMMFNIHNVRVDWDPMPMALKLRDVANLLEKSGQPTTAQTLSAVTGVSLASVRRALDLLALPQKYQQLLLREAAKPRHEQRVKADLFIEIYKSLHALERHAPEVLEAVPQAQYIDAMVRKYLSGVIDNVVAFREVSKMARAERAGIDREEVIPVLIRLAKNPKYSIDRAYEETVEAAYEKRDLIAKLEGIVAKLARYKRGSQLEDQLRETLKRVRAEINRLLG
jgi:ParB/RepB/Spo0J family partition protein